MRKALLLLFVICLAVSPHVAKAFSSEPAPINTDGAPKFTDPDEQMPNFVTGPDAGQAGLQTQFLDPAPVTPPTLGEYDQGAAAFNQAYSHLQKN